MKAANLGYAWGQKNLGVMYDFGVGVEVDKAKAAQWYRLAADQGHPLALNNLAILYKYGLGVEQDTSKAIELLRAAASKGLSIAAETLAGLENQTNLTIAKNDFDDVQ